MVPIQPGNDTSAIPTPQLIGNPNIEPVYKPIRSDTVAGLELNVANNVQSGDLVAGSYAFNGTNYASEDPNGPADPADEDPYYDRRDFTPSASASAGQTAPAFVARMRRTNNLKGLDSVPLVSSGGPPIYYLFGLGTSMHPKPGYSYSPREQGVTVRATAVAAAGPAVTGLSSPRGLAKTAGAAYWVTGVNGTVMLPGVAPFAIRGDLWSQLNPANPGSGSPVTVPLSTAHPQVTLLAPTPDPYYNPLNGASQHFVVSLVPPPAPPALLVAIGQPAQDETAVTSVISATEPTTGSGTTVTITTATANNLVAGQQVAIAGVGTGYDGIANVLTVPNSTSFTYTSASSGLGAVSNSGTVTSFDDSALSQPPGSAPYVPILAFPDLPSQSSTIVGFAYYIQWTYNKAAMTLTLSLASATTSPPVGSQNVSGALVQPLPAALSQQDTSTLFQDHDALANPLPENPPVYPPVYAPVLFAPVLVDHYLGPNATTN